MSNGGTKPTDTRILQVLRSVENRHRHTPDHEVYASHGMVARMIDVSAKTVQRHLATMEKQGIVRLKRRRGKPTYFRITTLGYQLLRFERPGNGREDKVSAPPRTGRPCTQDRMSTNKVRERIGDQQPLPAALLAKLERAYGRDQSRQIVGRVERYPWVVQVASIEVMLGARDRVKVDVALYAAGVAERLSERDKGTLDVPYDRPEYDPYLDGPPKESRNRPAWGLRELFPDADNLDEARKLEREQLEADEWHRRDRIASAEQLSREARIERWGAVPEEKLAASGHTSSEETGERAKAVVESLKRRGGSRAD